MSDSKKLVTLGAMQKFNENKTKNIFIAEDGSTAIAVEAAKEETKKALQLVYDTLNHGQQKQIIKQEEVKALFDRYGVEYSE